MLKMTIRGGTLDALESLLSMKPSFDMNGPFSGRIYNGTTMAIERLNVRVSCTRHNGSVAREAVYSFTERIEPLTVAEFSLAALRCDSVATMAWTVDGAYGHEVRNVRDAGRRVKGQSHGR